jgi:hypothetical protein
MREEGAEKKRKKRTNLQEEEEEEGKKKVTVANKEKSTCVVSYQWRETLRENAAGMSANASGT